MIDSLEVYEHLRDVRDPEHPLTMEQLRIICPENVQVDDAKGSVEVVFTPTTPTCSLPAHLGLCLREKLLRVLPTRFHSRLRVVVAPGTHTAAEAITRQLRDKERCLAVMEKDEVKKIIDRCISPASDVDNMNGIGVF
jgi:metal-sulfur cluster biosynthetic enzyme